MRGAATREAVREAILDATDRRLARFGLLGKGVLHAVIGLLALEIAINGGSSSEASASGAIGVARWRGVPVRLRSGKALGRPRTEAVITLKPVAHLPEGFEGAETPDTVTVGFKPPRLAIHLDVNGPGDPFELESSVVSTDLDPGDLTAYGEVLAGVLEGDPLLSVRGDVAEDCWRIVEPVLAAWRAGTVPMDTYPAGSDGPPDW